MFMFYHDGTVIIVAAIVLLILALFIPGVSGLLISALGAIGTAIGSIVWGLLCMIGKGIGSIFAGIGNGISALFSGVGDGLTAIFQAILVPVLILIGVVCLIWMIRRTFF